jgi:ADP-ribose pyrophosphatase
MSSEAKPLEIMHEGNWLRLVRSGNWEWVERPNTTGVVALYAFTDDDEVVLVTQPRRPLDARQVLEVPAGLVGDIPGEEDEPMSRAAQRELEEETGYRAGALTRLADVPTSPGITSESVTLYVARGLEKVGPGGGDDSEDIEVILVPMKEFDAYVKARLSEGMWVDPKVLAVPFIHANY